MPFIHNSDGKPSATVTMVFVAFGVVMMWLTLSIFENLGPLHIRAFSGADAMSVLSPLLIAYWGRRQQQLTSDAAANSSTSGDSGDK